MLLEDGGIVGGVFLVGKCVEVTADALQTVQDVESMASLSALEGRVLAEVCKPLLAGVFVARAGVDLIAAVDHRSGRRQVDNT